MKSSLLAPLVIVALIGLASAGQEQHITENQVERLAALGKVWGMVKYFHPYLAYKQVDWDTALVNTIPKVKAAHNPEQFRQAIDGLLNVLGDPLTTTESQIENTAPTSAAPKKEPVYYHVAGDDLIINAIDWGSAIAHGDRSTYAKLQLLLQEIPKAKRVVLDCRYGAVSVNDVPAYYVQIFLDNSVPALVQGSVTLGTIRYRIHNGYSPQLGNTSGGYSSSFVTDSPGAITGKSQTNKPLVVILDSNFSDFVPMLAGLQANGALIVGSSKPEGSGLGVLYRMQLPDGVGVKIRTTEFVHPNGSSEFKPDLRIDAGAPDEKVISEAFGALAIRSESKKAIAGGMTSGVPVSLRDEPYPAMSFPTEEYRLLALFRFWNVIEYFYPYKHLIDKPWGTVLTDFIPRFFQNKTTLDYEMTVAEMIARIQDSHGFVSGYKSLDGHLGTHAPPVTLGAIAGKLVVTYLSSKDELGIKVGDTVLEIDGQTAEQRIQYLAGLNALSTSQSLQANIYPTALRGAPNTKVKLKVASPDGVSRDLELTRSVPLESMEVGVPRSTPVYEKLPSGIGYMDLARLPRGDAQKALDALMDTPAIIFDMRGYPHGTAWELAPRLTEKNDVTAALFRRPYQSAANLSQDDFSNGLVPDFAFAQKLPRAKGAIYKGKVVMLINEDAISQAEHTCMFFEAATNVTFIGTPTQGANGDVTNLVLPGGISVSFSGHDVSHADGRQLQRVGIQPTIRVEPTIAGIRDGKDEILDAAIKFLNSTAKK